MSSSNDSSRIQGYLKREDGRVEHVVHVDWEVLVIADREDQVAVDEIQGPEI